MEKFLPILETIQKSLREIIIRFEKNILTWKIIQLRNIGYNLVSLAKKAYPFLIQVEHHILYLTLREAGLGIINRIREIEERKFKKEDKDYFKNVLKILKDICFKMETGEYYNALLAIAAKREDEVYYNHR
jgi:hypothetical protein